jgi:hypothetical protein
MKPLLPSQAEPTTFPLARSAASVAHAEGPTHRDVDWWRYQSVLTRDYFRVETAGRRFWLYREGLYGRAKPMNRAGSCKWLLHDRHAEIGVTTILLSARCAASFRDGGKRRSLPFRYRDRRPQYAVGVVRIWMRSPDPHQSGGLVPVSSAASLRFHRRHAGHLVYPTDRVAYGRLCRLLSLENPGA